MRADYVRNVWDSYYSWMTSGGVRRSWSWSTAGPSKERWSSMATLQESTMLLEHGVSPELVLQMLLSVCSNTTTQKLSNGITNIFLHFDVLSFDNYPVNFFFSALHRRHVKVPGWEDNPTEQVLTLIITTFFLIRNTFGHDNPHVWTLICLLCAGCHSYESSSLTPKYRAAPRCSFPGWRTRLTRYWMASSLIYSVAVQLK